VRGRGPSFSLYLTKNEEIISRLSGFKGFKGRFE
jgi:hypothetical protein